VFFNARGRHGLDIIHCFPHDEALALELLVGAADLLPGEAKNEE
jgi:hypothetical protein